MSEAPSERIAPALEPNAPGTLGQRARRWPRDAWVAVVHRQLSPQSYYRLTRTTIWPLAFIIVSGAAVRLTGSGLGCRDWPTCTSDSVVAPWHYHAWVEFGNRLVTGLVTVAVVLAVLGAVVRVRRRRDLTALSLGLVVALVAEIILGGVTVLSGLQPVWVMIDMLLAIVLLIDAVVLHHRAGMEDDPDQLRPGRTVPRGPARSLVSPEQKLLSRLLIVSFSLVAVLGTIVTSTGPNGGNPAAPRFPFELRYVAQLHGASADVFVLFTLATVWSLLKSGAPREVVRRGEILLAACVFQGLVGYTQYFLDVPPALVGLHVAGLVVIVVSLMRFHLSLTSRPGQAGSTGRLTRTDPAGATARRPWSGAPGPAIARGSVAAPGGAGR